MSDKTIDGLRYSHCQLRENVGTDDLPLYKGDVWATLQCRRCFGLFLDDEHARQHICIPQRLSWATQGRVENLRVEHRAPPHERYERLSVKLAEVAAFLAKRVDG